MKDKITIFVFLFGIVITAVCLYFAVPRVFPILATLLAVSVILYRFFDAAAKVNDTVKITGAGGVMVALFLVFFAFTKDDMEKPFLVGGRIEGTIELPIVLKYAQNLPIGDGCFQIWNNQNRVEKEKDSYLIRFREKETPTIHVYSVPKCRENRAESDLNTPVAIQFTLQRGPDSGSAEAHLRTLFITINQKMWQALDPQ